MLLLVTAALALDQVQGAHDLAVGGATAANPTSNASITANPALMGVDERYTFLVGGGYGDRGLHGTVAALDSKTAPVALGLAYTYDRYTPALSTAELPGWNVPGQEATNRKRYDDLALGLAFPFADRRLALGLGGAVSFYNHDRQGKGITGNATAGFAWRPDDRVTVGLTGRNLLPVNSPGRDPELLAGVWVGDEEIGALMLEGGARFDRGAPLLLAAGGEVELGSAARARLGWRLDDGRHRASLGFGFGTPDAGLDLALQAPIDALDAPGEWWFIVSARFKGPDFDAIQP